MSDHQNSRRKEIRTLSSWFSPSKKNHLKKKLSLTSPSWAGESFNFHYPFLLVRGLNCVIRESLCRNKENASDFTQTSRERKLLRTAKKLSCSCVSANFVSKTFSSAEKISVSQAQSTIYQSQGILSTARHKHTLKNPSRHKGDR